VKKQNTHLALSEEKQWVLTLVSRCEGATEKRREKGGGLMKQHAFGELETRQST
jgi:hypothetical protein